MLQNLTNFFNLIKTRKIKTQLDNSDLISVGTADPTWNGGYQPTAITYEDLAAQIGGGGGSISLTTSGTSGASTLAMGVLNIPQYQGQLTLTTSGTSGAATLIGNTLNIPDYFVYTYEIGQYVPSQKGVVFHRYLDGTNENYLVVGINDVSTGASWDNRTGPGQPPLLGCNSSWNGAANFATLNSNTGTQFTSAAYLLTFWGAATGLFDWYLPAVDELSLIWQNRFNINKTLSGNSTYGSIAGGTEIGANVYWSSTELPANTAAYFSFNLTVGFNGTGKINSYYVRAVRKFSLPI